MSATRPARVARPLPAARLARRLRAGLARRRPRRRRHARGLCAAGRAGLCDAGRAAAAARRLWLHPRRARLRAARLLAPPGDRADLGDLADGRGECRRDGGRRCRALRRRSPRWRPSPSRCSASIAWALRLSVLVKLISDSVLVGFKAGAGITIALTQLPSLFGVPGGGANVIERVVKLVQQIGQAEPGHPRARAGGDRAAGGRRAEAAGQAGRARRRHPVDRRRRRAGPRGAGRGRDRADPLRPAGDRPARHAPGGCRGHLPARRRHPAAGLYRGRLRRAQLRREARLRAEPAAGIPRPRRGQPLRRARRRLSGGGRPVAIGGRRDRRARARRSRWWSPRRRSRSACCS